jgi:hypothetical protein
MKEERILEEVEKTLNSLEQIPKQEANPFLYTRLKARIETESISQTKKRRTVSVLKPAGIALILAINIVTTIYFFDSSSSTQGSTSLIDSLSQEYKTNQIQLENYNLE